MSVPYYKPDTQYFVINLDADTKIGKTNIKNMPINMSNAETANVLPIFQDDFNKGQKIGQIKLASQLSAEDLYKEIIQLKQKLKKEKTGTFANAMNGKYNGCAVGGAGAGACKLKPEQKSCNKTTKVCAQTSCAITQNPNCAKCLGSGVEYYPCKDVKTGKNLGLCYAKE